MAAAWRRSRINKQISRMFSCSAFAPVQVPPTMEPKDSMQQLPRNLFDAVALAPIPGGLFVLMVIFALTFVLPPLAALMWIVLVTISFILSRRKQEPSTDT